MANILKEPTALIYSGYRLPVFDFLDKFPYVLVYKETLQYTVYCSAAPITIEVDKDGDYLLVREAPNCIKGYTSSDKTWKYTYEYTSQTKSYIKYLSTPIWSSHKITYPNGTTYIAKSNPPSALYEGSTESDEDKFDLYSWTVGLAFGLVDGLNMIDNSTFEEDIKNDTPVAFLYGHVTVDGEMPTYIVNGVGYVGVVAPDIFDVYTSELQKTYPFAYLHRKLWGGGCYLCISEKPYYWNENSLSTSGYALNNSSKDLSFFCETGGSAWAEGKCSNQIGIGGVPGDIAEDASTELYWVNVDIPNPDGNGIFLAASDPIPVSGIVGYSYNGVQLPKLPPKPSNNTTLGLPYDYVIIMDENYDRHLGEEPMYVADFSTVRALLRDGFVVPDDSVHAEYARESYMLTNGEWKRNGYVSGIYSTNGIFSTDKFGDRVTFWANHNIYNDEDGTLHIAASEPVPVYE